MAVRRCQPWEHPAYRQRHQPRIPVYTKKALADRYGLTGDGTIVVPCHYCGEPDWLTRIDHYVRPCHAGWPTPPTSFYFETGLQIDHVIPACVGGGDEVDNLVLACSSCNAKKGACWDGCWLGETA